MLRYTVLLTATLCVVLFSEMAANERMTFWIANEISEPHAYLRADCRACHEPWQGPNRDRCVACHVFPVIGRQSPEGAPEEAGRNPPTLATAVPDEPIQCAECHQEHLGLPKLVKADLSVARVHPLGHPKHGTCANCHADVDHGEVLPCAFCHKGDPTKTTERGSHMGMRAE